MTKKEFVKEAYELYLDGAWHPEELFERVWDKLLIPMLEALKGDAREDYVNEFDVAYDVAVQEFNKKIDKIINS